MGSAICDDGWYSEANFSPARPECLYPELWHTRDTQTVEAEVADMVFGLIRGLQPRVVLETGTSRGRLAVRIGRALDLNSWGHLHTYEPDLERWNEAVVNIEAVAGRVTCHREPSMQPWKWAPIEFAWFDSLTTLRAAEFEFYLPHMHERCVVGFHDTAPRFGRWTQQVRGLIDLDIIDLPTPRGVILGRVRS